jgi:Tfp pilus assembly protein PilF
MSNYITAEELVYRGIDKFERCDVQGAIADYTKAIAIHSKYAEAYYHRGFAYAVLGDLQSAIADFHQAASFFREVGDLQNHHDTLDGIKKIQQQQCESYL